MISKGEEQNDIGKAYLYRLSHPLGEYEIEAGKTCQVPESDVVFDITNHPVKLSVVEALKNKSGCLVLTKLKIDSPERGEYFLFNGWTDDVERLDQEIYEKFSGSGERFAVSFGLVRGKNNVYWPKRKDTRRIPSAVLLRKTTAIFMRNGNAWKNGRTI